MAKSKNACVAFPEVEPGKPSILYKGLLRNRNISGNRPLVNYVYTQYVASDAPEKMDALGYTRDKNGQHKASDVMNFFGVKDMLYEQSNIRNQERLAGVVDSSGNIIAYETGKEALIQASDYNKNSKGFVATIYKNKDSYYIKLIERNTLSYKTQREMSDWEEMYDITKQAFEAVGIDFSLLTDKYKRLYNITSPMSFVEYLQNLQTTDNKLLAKDELGFLLENLTGTEIDRLKSNYGDIEAVVNHIYDAYHTPMGGWTTAGEAALVNQALNKAKKLNGLDLQQLGVDLFTQSTLREPTEIEKQSDVWEQLSRTYGLQNTNIIEIGKNLNYLSQIAGRAVISANRRLKSLEKTGADLTTQREASIKVVQLLNEIDKKRYYAGLLSYLSDVVNDVNDIKDSFTNIEGVPGTMEYNHNSASAWIKAQDIFTAHKEVLEALSLLDSKIIDEDITDEDKQRIKQLATDLKNQFDVLEGQMKQFQYQTMLSIMTNVFGDELPDGRYTTQLLDMLDNDGSIMDRWLYAFGKVSNPIIGTMGKITKDAQDDRKRIQIEIQARIDRADAKLKKAGIKNTDWMFEDTKRGTVIRSQYLWDEYYKARNKYVKQLKASGLKGFALMEKVNQWEYDNTEEVVVSSSGRTERLPNDTYQDWDALSDLNTAQWEYYSEILNIKGDIEDMLPEWARSRYRPPQVWRELWDANNVKDFFQSIGRRVKNSWVREGDFDFLSNAILPEDAYFTDGDYNNDQEKRIPIFYVKHVNQKELLTKDLSGALNKLTQTAANFTCMDSVVDTVTMMQDYVENMPVRTKINGVESSEVLKNIQTGIFQKLFHKGSNTQAIMDGFIDLHYYGKRLEKTGWWTKVMQGLLRYTSIRGLSTNVLGGTSNFLVGEVQILTEAAGGKYFGMKSYLKAQGIMFGYGTAGKIGEFMDFMTNNNNSLATLIGNRFDPEQEVYEDMAGKRYYKGAIRHLLAVDPTFKVYGIGENLIHYAIMYAVLCEEKVLDKEGKKIDLYDAFEKSEKVDGSRTLKLKDGITTLDGRALTDINDVYLNEVADKIKKANQDCHGAMNQEDKGLISKHMWGRALMQMRQWMVEHYSRRFRGLHYDATEDGWTEGWWCTAMKFIAQYDHDVQRLSMSARLKTSTLKATIEEYQKEKSNRTLSDAAFKSLEKKAKLAQTQLANIKKFWFDLTITALLCTLSWGIMPAPKDLDEDFWTRFFAYQTKRLAWDQFTSSIGTISALVGLVENPVPAISTVNGLMYPIWGLILGHEFETLKSGPNKGENKYWRNIKKYTFPVYKDIQNLLHLATEESSFHVFDPNTQLTR